MLLSEDPVELQVYFDRPNHHVGLFEVFFIVQIENAVAGLGWVESQHCF